jgi:hypothetical protein
MKATIENLYYKERPAVQALLDDRKQFTRDLAKTEEMMDIAIDCNGIIVRDDLITVEFPDGLIGDYEIESDDYYRIIII